MRKLTEKKEGTTMISATEPHIQVKKRKGVESKREGSVSRYRRGNKCIRKEWPLCILII
jgi:hypothetical protein